MPEDVSAPGEIHALLGRGTAYAGKLTFEGRVRIDGTFDGEIFSSGTLIVGDSAQVKGEIDVGTLIVLGGLGFPVLRSLGRRMWRQKHRGPRFSLHTRLALAALPCSCSGGR